MTQRFERVGFEKWRPQPAIDRETGKRVLLPQPARGFLGEASLRTMAQRVQELADPRCAEIVCLDPFAVAAPPEKAPTGTLDEWARAAVECVDLLVMLRREGIVAMAGHDWGWAERRDGRLVPVVIAPAHAPSFGRRFARSHSWMGDVQSWLETRLPGHKLDRAERKLRKALKKTHEDHDLAVRSFFAALEPHLGGMDTTAIQDAALSVAFEPRVDFDVAIQLGEAAHAEMIREQRTKWDTPYVCWPLAAVYHHRGCLAWEQGNRDAALKDIDRAIELDPHPRYFTTRALYAEALEDPDAWRFHDAAMLAFLAPNPQREFGVEPPETRQRDECRSALARAAYRLRVRNDPAGAAEDLQFVKSRWARLEGELGAKVDAFLARLAT